MQENPHVWEYLKGIGWQIIGGKMVHDLLRVFHF